MTFPNSDYTPRNLAQDFKWRALSLNPPEPEVARCNMPPATQMATFTPFPRLPFELRARIWESTIEPRTVQISVKKNLCYQVLHMTSSTPVPPMLQACHEARNHQLYQRSFSSGVEPRYVWVNFDYDTISIGVDTRIEHLEPERNLIRRFILERENNESFFHFESEALRMFSNMVEIHVICKDGLLAWQEAWESVYFPCPAENLRFIDKQTGQVADGWELEKMQEDWIAAREAEDVA